MKDFYIFCKWRIFIFFVNEGFLYFEDMNDIDESHFLFPIKEPFRTEQLAKILIQWLWIDYIDWKMTTFYETNKSKFNHTNHARDITFNNDLQNC